MTTLDNTTSTMMTKTMPQMGEMLFVGLVGLTLILAGFSIMMWAGYAEMKTGAFTALLNS
jgi:hypothetical protein